MKKHLLSQVAALCLLAPISACLVTLPAAAATASGAPQARGLEVNADSGVAPGSQLRLSFEGSPGGQASARLPGANIVVPLKEVAPGQYEGRYTVRRSDRIDPTAVIRVSIKSGNQTAVANYTFPPSFLAVASAPAQPTVIVQPPVVVQAVPPAPLRIERFAVAPVGRAAPGAELMFRLQGVPGASASFDIPGVVSDVPMREVRPGYYEGTYTVRRQDNLLDAGPVTATLRSRDNRVATSTLREPLVSDNRPPQITNLEPREGEAVPRGPTQVSGNFRDMRGAGVDPSSVRIVVSGRDVTDLAKITPREFSFEDRLPPGRHTVEVTAADRAGNVAQKTWSFDVGGAVMGAPSVVLPLMVMSHTDNAMVGHELTTVRGRTAPNAIVRVRVDAVSPVAGRRGRTGVAEQIVNQTVQADANGEFAFTFNPRIQREGATTLPIPGTRYEVSITANRDNQTAESRLLLFQRS